MGIFRFFAIFFALLSLFLGLLPQYCTEARPLLDAKGTEVGLGRMSTLGAEKKPSPGEGNASNDWNRKLGRMIKSGPSPGVGHKHVTGGGGK